MKDFSNTYILRFVLIMVVVVATVLSFSALSLQPVQKKNLVLEKKSNILSALSIENDFSDAEQKYEEYVQQAFAVDITGKVLEGVNAFDLELKQELNKPEQERQMPLYIGLTASKEKAYIIPVRGIGLWGPIWGYIAVGEDLSSILGITFDHETETPGLGAEIKDDPGFANQFKGKQLFSGGNFTGIRVLKGSADASAANTVNAISGATITANGVEDMIRHTMVNYLPYFKQNR